MAIVFLQVASGPGWTLELQQNDLANTWTEIRLTNSTGKPLRATATASGVSATQVFAAGTTTFTFAIPVPLASQVNWKGETVLGPLAAVGFALGVSQDG